MTSSGEERGNPLHRLRRDLGTLESYAALIGILVGAGIFSVTGAASKSTGPSIILGYVVLAPAVLANSIAYAVFLSTPLGRLPGGEYSHIGEVFKRPSLAFIAVWLKLISYLGAGAFLAVAQADYLLKFAAGCGLELSSETWRTPIALFGLLFFHGVHFCGARWFGRLQVAMCAVLGISILALVAPGLFAIRVENYSPFFTGGSEGFFTALAPLFFAYAGFEAIAHTAGEVKDSTRSLPRVFVRGVAATTLVFFLMSVVAFGVLPIDEMTSSSAPMADVAARFLPRGAAELVTIGGVLAVATSLNATIFSPARLALMLAHDGLLPRWLGWIHPQQGTPTNGLLVSLVITTLLVVSGQIFLALTIAVFALVLIYVLHSYALLALPRRAPELFAAVTSNIPRWLQIAAALLSIGSMGALAMQIMLGDLDTLGASTFLERWNQVDGASLTTLELIVAWSLVGLVLFRLRPARRTRPESTD